MTDVAKLLRLRLESENGEPIERELEDIAGKLREDARETGIGYLDFVADQLEAIARRIDIAIGEIG